MLNRTINFTGYSLGGSDPWPGVETPIEISPETCAPNFLYEIVFVVMIGGVWQVFSREDADPQSWADDGYEFHAATRLVCGENEYLLSNNFYDIRQMVNICCNTGGAAGCPEFTINFHEDRPPSSYNVSIYNSDGIGVFQTDNDGPLTQSVVLPAGTYWFYIEVLNNEGRMDFLNNNGGGMVDWTDNSGNPSTQYDLTELGCAVFVEVGVG